MRLLLFAVSFPIFGWPAAFGWLVIAPIVAVAWVARVRTTVTPDGLEVRRLFGGRSWGGPRSRDSASPSAAGPGRP